MKSNDIIEVRLANQKALGRTITWGQLAFEYIGAKNAHKYAPKLDNGETVNWGDYDLRKKND